MRCLLLKVFLVILTAVTFIYGQEKNDPQALRFNDGAVDLYNAEKYAPAIEALDRALALEPNNAIYHYNRGMAYYRSGEFAKAATSFRRVTELRPEYALGHNQLGVSLMETHQDAMALVEFNTALRLAPNSPATQFNTGCIYVRMGRFKDAIEILEKSKATQTRAPYADLYINLGYAYGMRKQYEKAIASVQKAIEIDPKPADWQYFLGILYLRADQRDAAIRQQKIVESMDPEIGRKLYREVYKDKLLFVSDNE